MNCAEVDELLGAYALDALPADEAAQVRAHLAGCPEQAEKAAELRSVAVRLSAAAEPVAPPVELRARVLRASAREPQEPLAGRGEDARPPSDGQRFAPGRIVRFAPRVSITWASIAAVVVAAIIGLAVWNIVLQTRGGGASVDQLARRATKVTTLEASGAPGSGVVIFYKDERKALVVADGMRPLDPAKNTYQLWAIDGGKPTSIGLMQVSSDGHAVMVVPFDAARAKTLAVTIEPPGGSLQPTSAPIMRAQV